MAKQTPQASAGSVNAVIEHAVRAGPAAGTTTLENGALLRVPLADIGPHPDQPRQVIQEDRLRELMAGIVQAGGLLQPINIRPSVPADARPDDEHAYPYRLIAGQRRLEAYRRLLATATSEDDRKQYSTIPAVLRLGRDRADALKDAILENIQRDDLVPLDAAEALAKLKREAGHKSAKELATAVGQKEDRVKRLLRLNEAPDVVKTAVRTGLLVTVQGDAEDASDRGRKEHLRKLDLMEALEFSRLHDHYLRKSASRKPEVAQEQADGRTRNAIERALREGWGYRRIQEQVESIVSGATDAEGTGPKKAGPSFPPYRATGTELVIRRHRLGSATASELDLLEQLLRGVLSEVEKARATLPALPAAAPQSPPVALPQT